MDAILRVRLLGDFSLSFQDSELTSLHATRLQMLLAYLLLHRDSPVSRQQLAFLFWPESLDSQSQTNLRQLLHGLRRKWPEAVLFVDISERTIGWRKDSPYLLDVAEFSRALSSAEKRSEAAAIAALENAVDAYHGDLLPGCYEDWILPERESLAEKFIGALERLIALHEELRDYPAAIVYAQRLLRHDPVHEATYRCLIRLHALNNDRAAALRTFHNCSSVLERELGVPPSAATLDLYEQLLHVSGSLRIPVRAAGANLVGREGEWKLLMGEWRNVKQGGARCVVLLGEPGIGKTCLAEQLTHWAEQQGMTASWIKAYAGDSELAYAPVIECLRSDAVRSRLAKLDGIWLTELTRLLPELLSDWPTLPRPEPLTERWQRPRLFEAVTRALAQPGRPLLLVVDDLQWCDSETVDWLFYLLHSDASNNVLVVATLRASEIDAAQSPAQFMLRMRSAGYLTEIELGPLDREHTAQLAEQIAEHPFSIQAADRVFEATEGNPLYIVETMRAAIEVTSHGAGEGGGDLHVPKGTMPPKMQAVIQARLAQLTSPTRDLLGLAATIGRSFTFDVLASASGGDDDAIVRSIDELWQRRVIREQGVSAYDFTHDRIREVAYNSLSQARRRLLHKRVAEVLEQQVAEDRDTLCAQLAFHYEQIGQWQRAAQCLHRAGEAARRVYANRDAIGLLEHGVHLLQRLPSRAATTELELELQMSLCGAWAASTSYISDDAEAVFGRALALCRQAPGTLHLFAVLWGLHEFALYKLECQTALDLARQCLDIAENTGDDGLLLEGHHGVWGPLHFMGRYEEARIHMEHGLALYDRFRHEPLSATYGVHDAGSCALYLSAIGFWNEGCFEQAAQRHASGIRLLHELTLPANLADSGVYAALLYQLQHQPVEAQPYAEEALRLSTEKDYPFSHILGAVILGWSLAKQGKAEEGVAVAREGLGLCKAIGQRVHRSHLGALLSEACLIAGQYKEAIDVLVETQTEYTKYHDLFYAPELYRLHGDALHLLNAPASEVETCYLNAQTLARQQGDLALELRAVVSLARLSHSQGHPEKYYALLEELLGQFSEGFSMPELLAAIQLRDELAHIMSSSQRA